MKKILISNRKRGATLLPAENRLGQGSQGTYSCWRHEKQYYVKAKVFYFVCLTQYTGGNKGNIELVLQFLFWLLLCIILLCIKIYSSWQNLDQVEKALLINVT